MPVIVRLLQQSSICSEELLRTCMRVADPPYSLKPTARCAGTYNEEVFAALDWVLDQASRRGLRIIIPFEVRFCLQGGTGAHAYVGKQRGFCALRCYWWLRIMLPLFAITVFFHNG